MMLRAVSVALWTVAILAAGGGRQDQVEPIDGATGRRQVRRQAMRLADQAGLVFRG